VGRPTHFDFRALFLLYFIPAIDRTLIAARFASSCLYLFIMPPIYFIVLFSSLPSHEETSPVLLLVRSNNAIYFLNSFSSTASFFPTNNWVSRVRCNEPSDISLCRTGHTHTSPNNYIVNYILIRSRLPLTLH
jgi:hypothetical protein